MMDALKRLWKEFTAYLSEVTSDDYIFSHMAHVPTLAEKRDL